MKSMFEQALTDRGETARLDYLLALKKRYKTHRHIAEHYGVSVKSVEKLYYKKITHRAKHPPCAFEQAIIDKGFEANEDYLLRLLQEHQTYLAIAEYYQVSLPLVTALYQKVFQGRSAKNDSKEQKAHKQLMTHIKSSQINRFNFLYKRWGNVW
jgi:uncharacterized protein YdbL (DUF1318 family)